MSIETEGGVDQLLNAAEQAIADLPNLREIKDAQAKKEAFKAIKNALDQGLLSEEQKQTIRDELAKTDQGDERQAFSTYEMQVRVVLAGAQKEPPEPWKPPSER